MQMNDIPFGTTDWSTIEPTMHPSDVGAASWRTRNLGAELHTELEDGRTFVLRPGMSYQVADNAEPHRSSTQRGARLFIVD
jgi:hypothetical protein